MTQLTSILDEYFLNDYKLKELHTIQTSTFIESVFSFHQLTIHKLCFTLLICKKKLGIKDLTFYNDKFHKELKEKVLFFSDTSFACSNKAMVKHNIGFISHRGQIFIPYIYMNLSKENKDEEVQYRKSTQQIAQFYLLNPKCEYTSSDIQKSLNISLSNINRANRFLYKVGGLSKKGNGTKCKYQKKSNQLLYESIKKYFMNPIQEYCFVPFVQLKEQDIIAQSSNTALMRRTHIYSDETCYVVTKSSFSFYKSISIHPDDIESKEDIVRIECFKYEPIVLPSDKLINVIDLICIYRDSKDSRIQIEIETLEELIYDEMLTSF